MGYIDLSGQGAEVPGQSGLNGPSWPEGEKGTFTFELLHSASSAPALPSPGGCPRSPKSRVRYPNQATVPLLSSGLIPSGLALAPLCPPSQDGEPNNFRSATHHGGQDLLRRRFSLPGGYHHLPAGHCQSPSSGRVQSSWQGFSKQSNCCGHPCDVCCALTALSQGGSVLGMNAIRKEMRPFSPIG